MPPTLVDALVSHAVTQPDRRVCTFLDGAERETGSRSFAALDARCRAIASWLTREDFAGKIVLLLLGDGLQFVEAFMGCLYAGVVPVPVIVPRPNRPLSHVRGICRDAAVAGVLTSRAEAVWFRPALAAHLTEVVWLCLEDADDSGADWPRAALHPDRLAFLQYTSGSTAAPKGVMVTHANLMH